MIKLFRLILFQINKKNYRQNFKNWSNKSTKLKKFYNKNDLFVDIFENQLTVNDISKKININLKLKHMKLQKNLEHLKNFDCLKLHLNYNKKNGVLALKTISETTIARAGGYGYNKVGTVFKEFFLKLGFNVENICSTKFDLFAYSINDANKFLENNNTNYKIFYRSEINNNISFIELNKIQ